MAFGNPDKPGITQQTTAWHVNSVSTLTVSSQTDGNAIYVGDYLYKTFFTSPQTSANNVTIDVSMDGTNWIAALSGAAQVSATSASINNYVQWVKLNARTWSSGTPQTVINLFA